eukprot:284817135_4
MPSVIQTISGTWATTASRMAAAAPGGGTITVASHCVSFTASSIESPGTHKMVAQFLVVSFWSLTSWTEPKTGRLLFPFEAVQTEPAFLGWTPPTILVPYSIACSVKVPWKPRKALRTCFPVSPHMTFVFLSTKTFAVALKARCRIVKEVCTHVATTGRGKFRERGGSLHLDMPSTATGFGTCRSSCDRTKGCFLTISSRMALALARASTAKCFRPFFLLDRLTTPPPIQSPPLFSTVFSETALECKFKKNKPFHPKSKGKWIRDRKKLRALGLRLSLRYDKIPLLLFHICRLPLNASDISKSPFQRTAPPYQYSTSPGYGVPSAAMQGELRQSLSYSRQSPGESPSLVRPGAGPKTISAAARWTGRDAIWRRPLRQGVESSAKCFGLIRYTSGVLSSRTAATLLEAVTKDSSLTHIFCQPCTSIRSCNVKAAIGAARLPVYSPGAAIAFMPSLVLPRQIFWLRTHGASRAVEAKIFFVGGKWYPNFETGAEKPKNIHTPVSPDGLFCTLSLLSMFFQTCSFKPVCSYNSLCRNGRENLFVYVLEVFSSFCDKDLIAFTEAFWETAIK